MLAKIGFPFFLLDETGKWINIRVLGQMHSKSYHTETSSSITVKAYDM